MSIKEAICRNNRIENSCRAKRRIRIRPFAAAVFPVNALNEKKMIFSSSMINKTGGIYTYWLTGMNGVNGHILKEI
jgi:hypothetical protein